jgi:uncharacterized protein (TIGR00730 family)
MARAAAHAEPAASDGARPSVGLFCSAADGLPVPYRDAAAEFGRLCALHGFRLVYGGSGRGLMGLAAHAALAGGGAVTGVMPRHLAARERAETRLGDLRMVDGLAERKQVMADLSDVFFVLPGGVGTLDEAFEMVTWYDIGLHRKPTVFIDVEGFWTPLLAVFDHLDRQGMLRAHLRGGYQRIASVGDMPQTARVLASTAAVA